MRNRKGRERAAAVVAAFSALYVLGAACHFDALLGSGSKGGSGGGGGGGGGGNGGAPGLASLVQLRNDSLTPIPTGGSAPEPSMVLAAVVRDKDAAATLRLEVEVQPVGTAFQDQTMAVSDPALADTRAYVWVGGLQDNTGYHWQARVVDSAGNRSGWQTYGRNAETAADVRVALPVMTTRLEFRQQPATSQAGATMPPVKVAVLDGQGNVIPNFPGTVSVRLVNANGASLGGNPNNAPVQSGIATFSDLSMTQAGSNYKLDAVSEGVAGATSVPFAINPQIAHHPKFLVQPSNTTPNRPIAPAVQVAVLDLYGNVATSFTGTVYMAIANNGSPTQDGVLEPSGTKRNASAGIATFEDLQIDKVGVGYTLEASAVAVDAKTSEPFSVLVTLP